MHQWDYVENEFGYAGDEIVFVNANADTVVMSVIVIYNPELVGG